MSYVFHIIAANFKNTVMHTGLVLKLKQKKNPFKIINAQHSEKESWQTV